MSNCKSSCLTKDLENGCSSKRLIIMHLGLKNTASVLEQQISAAHDDEVNRGSSSHAPRPRSTKADIGASDREAVEALIKISKKLVSLWNTTLEDKQHLVVG